MYSNFGEINADLARVRVDQLRRDAELHGLARRRRPARRVWRRVFGDH